MGAVVFAEGCLPGLCGACPADVLQAVDPCRPIVVCVGEAEVLASRLALDELPKLCRAWDYRAIDSDIERSEDGALTGRFRGRVWSARFALLSPASMASRGIRGLRSGLGELARHGIVACTDAFVFEDRVPMYELALAEGQAWLPRTSLALGFKSHLAGEELGGLLERVASSRVDWPETGYRLCMREAKVEVDGAWQWSSSSRHGGPSWDLAALDQVIERMVGADFSMHCHVFGDLAAKHTLKTLRRAEEAAPRAAGGPAGRRHKLAHVFGLQPEDEAALPCASTVAVFQPFWFSDKAWNSYSDDAVAFHQRLASRGLACYGSDWDISSLSPLDGMAEALLRPGAIVGGSWSERLAQALRMQTLEAARAMWLEGHSGSLEAGKLADMCILDLDIFDLDPAADGDQTAAAAGLGASVVTTIAAGAIVYDRAATHLGTHPSSSVPAPPAAIHRRQRNPLRAQRAGPAKSEDAVLSATCTCVACGWAGWQRRGRTTKLCTAAFGGRP